MDYGLNYGYYQPHMFFPMMDFSGMQNYMSYYPQYSSVFTPQTTAQVASQQQVAQQQAKVEVKEEPKEKKDIFVMGKDGSFKNVKYVETTPEKMEEYKKAYKKDSNTKTSLAIGSFLASMALAGYVGPKAFKAMKLKDGNIFKFLFASADKTENVLLSGLLLGGIPGAFIADRIDGSIGKGLDKKIFGEDAVVVMQK